MPTMLTRLRLATSMAHHTPDGLLTLERVSGRSVESGFHNEADVTLCQLRQMLMSPECPAQAEAASRVTGVTLGGAFEAVAGDLYRVRRRPHEERWFATLLHPAHVFDLMEGLDCEPEIASRVIATLKPDHGLAVTTVCITVDNHALEPQITALAQAAYEACLVEELLLGAYDTPEPGVWCAPEDFCGARTSLPTDEEETS